MHHTKDKGDLGVLKAQLDLFEQGFIIALLWMYAIILIRRILKKVSV